MAAIIVIVRKDEEWQVKGGWGTIRGKEKSVAINLTFPTRQEAIDYVKYTLQAPFTVDDGTRLTIVHPAFGSLGVDKPKD